MPMNGNAMGQEIWDAVKAATGQPDSPEALAVWKAVAGAIVAHIKTNAQIPAGIAVSTTGSASAQTGATTAPGTVQ